MAGLHQGRLRGHPAGEPARGAGRPDYNFPAFKAGDVIKTGVPTTSGEPMQGFVLNMRRPQFQDRRVRAGADLGLRFREHEPHAVLSASTRAPTAISRAASWPPAACRTARSWKSSNRTRTSCRRSCSRRNSSCRSTTRRRPSAQNLRQAVELFAEAGWKIKDGKMLNDKTGEQFRIEILGNDPTDEVISDALHRQAAQDRHRRVAAHRRHQPVRQPLRNFDFDMRDRRAWRSRNRPATSSATSGARKAADTPGSRNLIGHQGSGRRRAGRARDLRHRPRGPRRRHPRARPRAAVELLRRAAVAPAGGLDRLLEQVRHPREAADLYRRRHRIPGGSTRPRKSAASQVQERRIERARASRAATSWRSARRLPPRRCCPAGFRRQCPTDQPLHGLSAFGDLKYAPDFTHFDYVNPDAPKGGTFNFSPPNWVFNQSTLTFNTLNSFVPKGDAPPRMEMCFDCADGARARRAGRALRPAGRDGDHLATTATASTSRCGPRRASTTARR